MNKTIAIICEYILMPERIGGMDRFFKAFDEVLKEKGYKVTWFFKDAKPFDFYKNLDVKNAKNSNLENFFIDYCTQNNVQFNIVITHFIPLANDFFKKIKKQFNPYCIAVDHNPRPLEGFPFKKRLKNKLKGILFSKYVDKYVGVSEYTKKHILHDFGNFLHHKTSVIYNGIDVDIYKKQLVSRNKYPLKFMVVSHLRESKGIQDLLKAINHIDKKLFNKFSVDIFGDGPYKEELVRMTNEFQLNELINFKGNSPNLNSLFCNYHYMVQSTYMECFSLSILESLASNVPVITTTVGGNPEIIQNNINGFLFEAKDVMKLKEILEGILENTLIIDKNVALEVEQNYTLNTMVNNHLKLVECI